MSTKSIARRVTVSALTLVLLVFALALMANYFFFTVQAKKANLRNLNDKLSHYGDMLTIPMISRDVDAIREIGRAFAKEEGVSYLRIYLAGVKSPVYQEYHKNSPDTVSGTHEVTYENATVGVLEMGLMTEEYAQTIRVMFWYSISISLLIAFTLSVCLQAFVRTYLGEPLETLAGWTRKVAEGEYDGELAPIEEKELTGVAVKFMEMASKVREREKLLIESEKKFRDLAELLPQMVFETDVSGRLTYANRFGRLLFEFSDEEFEAGKNIIDLVLPFDRKRARANMALRYEGREVADNEYEMVTAGGRVFSSLIYSTAIMEDSFVKGLRGIIVDVTERKKLQDQLVQSQKMEAIGTLASGIAHDFNNLLQMISGYSEYLLMNRNRDAEDRVGINRIREAALTAGSLVQRILTFSRKRDPEMCETRLNQSVQRAAEMLGRTIPRMIEIRIELEKELWPVMADAAQLDQVLLNLALNARDAMPEGGVLTIATSNVSLDPAAPHPRGLAPGRYVRLTVADTGIGMDEETRSNIFKPFFTTKEVGKGTGLGLSSVFGIAANHGGTVVCESSPGSGSTFSIYLPAYEGDPPRGASTEEEQCAALDMGEGRERILVVDDEAIVRELACSMLLKRGYEVVEAVDGETALTLYEEQLARSGGSRGFDAVVLDVGMPGMGGRRCLEELLKLDPGARVLLASGYSVNSQARGVDLMGAAGFIAKPFRLTALVRQLREILDRPR